MKNKDRGEGEGKSFISGVFVLSLSTLIVKIMGLAFKIPMLSILGMEGMGYFNSAYEIYAVLCVISTAGLPVALSMLISSARASDDIQRIKGVYHSALKIFFALGVTGSAIMLFLAEPLAKVIGNEDACYSIAVIAPALLFICLASAVRGYCQGFENMHPTAISQLIEAFSKLALGVLFAIIGIKKGLSVPKVSALAVLGITLGCLFSLVYLLFAKRKMAVRCDFLRLTERKSFAKELLKIALPITLGSAVISFTRILDMGLILRRLQDIGVSQLDANKIYGAYTTLALPVFSLIPSLIAPISMALIPELAGFIERKNVAGQRQTVEKSIRLTTALAMPAAIAVMLFSNQILSVLFVGQTEAVDIAAPLLALLGASILFSCLITTTNAILQSYRRAGLPIISMAVGLVVKTLVSYFLLGIEGVGVHGAPIGSLACNVTVVLLNFAFIIKYAKNTDGAISILKTFIKPLLASVCSIGTAYAMFLIFMKQGVSELLSFCLAVVLAVLLYFVFVFLLGILNRDELKMFPGFNKILKERKR